MAHVPQGITQAASELEAMNLLGNLQGVRAHFQHLVGLPGFLQNIANLNNIDSHKDGKTCPTVSGTDIFKEATRQLYNVEPPSGDFISKKKTAIADAVAFSLIKYGTMPTLVSFFSVKSFAELNHHDLADESVSINPIPTVKYAFHDSGYGPSKVFATTTRPILEITTQAVSFDEGPGAGIFADGRYVVMYSISSLEEVDLQVVGFQHCLNNIRSQYEYGNNGAAPTIVHKYNPYLEANRGINPIVNETGRMILRLESKFGGLATFTRDNGFNTIAFSADTRENPLNATYSPHDAGEAGRSKSRIGWPIGKMLFEGNPPKNRWISHYRDGVDDRNLLAVTKWMILAKEYGDTGQILSARLLIGMAEAFIILYCMFTGDDIVMARSVILGLPVFVQYHASKRDNDECDQEVEEDLAKVGKATYFVPSTDPTVPVKNHLNHTVSEIITNNTNIIRNILRLLHMTQTPILIVIGAFKQRIIAVDSPQPESVLLADRPCTMNQDMIDYCIMYIKSILVVNYIIVHMVEHVADTIPEMEDIERRCQEGIANPIIDYYKKRNDPIARARVLNARSQFKLGSSFSNRGALGQIAATLGQPITIGVICAKLHTYIPHAMAAQLARIIPEPFTIESLLHENGLDCIIKYRTDKNGSNSSEQLLRLFNRRQGHQQFFSKTVEAADLLTEPSSKRLRRSAAASSAALSRGGGKKIKQKGGYQVDQNADPTILFYELIENVMTQLADNVTNIDRITLSSREYSPRTYGFTQELFNRFIESMIFSPAHFIDPNIKENFIEIASYSFYSQYIDFFKRIGYTCLDEDVIQYFIFQYMAGTEYSRETFELDFFSRALPYRSLKEEIQDLHLIIERIPNRENQVYIRYIQDFERKQLIERTIDTRRAAVAVPYNARHASAAAAAAPYNAAVAAAMNSDSSPSSRPFTPPSSRPSSRHSSPYPNLLSSPDPSPVYTPPRKSLKKRGKVLIRTKKNLQRSTHLQNKNITPNILEYLLREIKREHTLKQYVQYPSHHKGQYPSHHKGPYPSFHKSKQGKGSKMKIRRGGTRKHQRRNKTKKRR